jgi:hypothetical protein
MLNNRIQNRLSAEHIAYCAGLFDGEGCVQYKIYPRKYKSGNMGKVWGITMEINMTEIEPLHYFLNVVKHGSVTYKKNYGIGKKDQWRWRVSHRKAFAVAKMIYPYSIVKRPKLLKNN